MDISNEAHLHPFLIGPSSVVGRAVALKILLCKSMWHLRRQVFGFLLGFLAAFRDFLGPMISWLHPRNPRGVLAMMTILALLLKRYGNVKARAELAYRRKFWKNMMRGALTYEEWAHAARMLDKETLKMNESDLYDEELVRNKLQELRHRRQNGLLRDIMFYMRADLFRNLGNMCNPDLHKGRLYVPKLIKEYIDEVSTQLRLVCNSDSEELVLEEKLAFMHETRHSFGRTALLLSGGATLGAFHVGVVRTLIEHKLLPRIIAGTSAGSIVCAIVATRSWPELQSFFEGSWLSFRFFDQMGGIFTVVERVMRHGAVHEIRQLQVLLRNLTSNLTFQEAYDMTGRVLGITVCSPRKHEPPRCLNYLTSPHVVIWSAVTASCAFPGLFEAQELMAKNRSGELVPYHPPFHLELEEGLPIPGRRWRDGGLENDLPKIQLKELFNVNHFIVSQANPHASAILRLKEFVRAYGGSFAAKVAHIAEMEVKHRCNQLLKLCFPFGGVSKVLVQDWEGDITVVVPATLTQYLKLIQNPTHVELQKATILGRRCIWEKLSAIKANCGIELALDECVAILNHMRRLKRSAERAAAASSHGLSNTVRFSASRRIPSWNCIARENSTGSFEEDLLTDAPSSLHQVVGGHAGGASCPNLHSYRNMHDGSDSESETVDHPSWTQTGGPLMRTSSANMFIDYFHSLDGEAEMNRGPMIHSNHMAHHQSSRVMTPDGSSESTEYDQREVNYRGLANKSSITMTEGDLLQPEKIFNGIVFNVVKMENLALPRGNCDWPNHSGLVTESIQLHCQGEEMDLSEYGDSTDITANRLIEMGHDDANEANCPCETVPSCNSMDLTGVSSDSKKTPTL